jgi:hypothetical protein
VKEPAEDDGEPTDEKEEEEASPATEEEEVEKEEEEEKEEEAPAEKVDNITETILSGYTPMPCYQKRRLNPPSPNTIMEDEDDSSLE